MDTVTVAAVISALPLAFLCVILSGPGVNMKIGNVILAFVLVGIILAFARHRWRWFNDDLRKGEIANIEGRVRLDIADNGRSSSYSVAIEKTIFRINKQVFLAFKNGDPYRIYYAPHSMKMLSAEWLRDG
jgi:hypothetical protein